MRECAFLLLRYVGARVPVSAAASEQNLSFLKCKEGMPLRDRLSGRASANTQ